MTSELDQAIARIEDLEVRLVELDYLHPRVDKLKDIIRRARLAVTVTGLTVLGMENACKQAKQILEEL